MLLVGFIDGGVELVEVLRSNVNLPHELQTTKIEESARGKDLIILGEIFVRNTCM